MGIRRVCPAEVYGIHWSGCFLSELDRYLPNSDLVCIKWKISCSREKPSWNHQNRVKGTACSHTWAVYTPQTKGLGVSLPWRPSSEFDWQEDTQAISTFNRLCTKLYLCSVNVIHVGGDSKLSVRETASGKWLFNQPTYFLNLRQWVTSVYKIKSYLMKAPFKALDVQHHLNLKHP